MRISPRAGHAKAIETRAATPVESHHERLVGTSACKEKSPGSVS